MIRVPMRLASWRSVVTAFSVLATAALLAGCISLFPKQKPALLYEFGQTAPPAAAATGERRFTVQPQLTGFDRASIGDRILTVQPSGEVAYIKGARWVTSALAQFDQAVQRAFDANAGPARLMAKGELGRGDFVLKLDVRRFEARYEGGADAAPTVYVEVHAVLGETKARVGAQHIFTAKVRAEDNRVGVIAHAFDEAVAKITGDLVAWVNGRGAETA